MRVTVVIPVKNGGYFLPKVLEAIYSQRTDFDFDVIVIDSGSQDKSLQIVSRYPVQLVEIPASSFNHGETRNLGARLAEDSDFVVFLSQDAIPANDKWLMNLIQPLRKDSGVAGTFSRHVPKATSKPAAARQLTTVWQSGGSERLVKQMPSDPEEYEQNKIFYAYFSNTSSALRRSVWLEMPFRRLMFAEDIDWADRVLRAGYKIVFEPTSMVIHSHDYSLLEQFRQNADHAAGMIHLFDGSVYKGFWTWLKLFLAVPLESWRDWEFMRTSLGFSRESAWRKLTWLVHSLLWHGVSTLGAWIGAHIRWLPKALRPLISRQERIRRCP
jgi:rhamnosyltransferase